MPVVASAVATHRATHDPSAALKGALATAQNKSYAVITEPKQVGELIARQLSHGDRNLMRAAYNFAEYLQERRKMMQEWANYLDGLAAGAQVVSIGAAHKK